MRDERSTPEMPTPEMIEEGIKALARVFGFSADAPDTIAAIWRAMQAAAPKPAAQVGERKAKQIAASEGMVVALADDRTIWTAVAHSQTKWMRLPPLPQGDLT